MNKLVDKLQRFQELNYEMGERAETLNSPEMQKLFLEREALFWELSRALEPEHRAAETSDPQEGKRRTIRGYECQRLDGFIWDGDRFLAIYPGYLTRVVVEQAHRIEMLEKQLAEHRAEPSDDSRLNRYKKERDETIAKLREVCADYGDNDWPDNLHMVDIIEKHLYRNLWYAYPLTARAEPSADVVDRVARALAIRNGSVLVATGAVRIDNNHIADAKAAIAAMQGE